MTMKEYCLAEGAYSEKQPNGWWKYYWQRQLFSEGQYDNGKRTGIWSVYAYPVNAPRVAVNKKTYIDGNLREVKTYNLRGKLHYILESSGRRKNILLLPQR